MRIELLNIPVDGLSVEELHAELRRIAAAKEKRWVLNVNVHALNLAQADPEFAGILRRAHLVFCDGEGVRLGARLFGHRLPPRITYADWIMPLGSFCASENLTLFFLGGRPGVAEEARKRLEAAIPGIRIVGCQHGHFDKEGPENQAVIDRINAARPNLLLVGLGMPLQEKWIAAHSGRIAANVFLSAGACLDYVAGRVRRGPRWMLDHGFEWLFRLLIEPRRMWGRYVWGNARYGLHLARALVSQSAKKDKVN